jgi:hypothetical protein
MKGKLTGEEGNDGKLERASLEEGLNTKAGSGCTKCYAAYHCLLGAGKS